MLWGVAGGLGEYLDIDPTLVRLGFVVAAFFGGFGLIAYLVMAVALPEDDGTGRPSSGRRPPTWAIASGNRRPDRIPGPFFGWHDGWGGPWGFRPLWIGFLIIAGVAVRASRRTPPGTRRPPSGTTSPPESTDEHRRGRGGRLGAAATARAIALVVLALAAICAALCVAAVAAGRPPRARATSSLASSSPSVPQSRPPPSSPTLGASRPWLLASALLLAAPAGAIAAADIHFDGGIGERAYSPASVSDIPADGYEFGVGQMVVDLRELPWAEGQAIPDSTLGPRPDDRLGPSVCVDADANAKAGELIVRGETSDGVDAEIDQGEPTGAALHASTSTPRSRSDS